MIARLGHDALGLQCLIALQIGQCQLSLRCCLQPGTLRFGQPLTLQRGQQLPAPHTLVRRHQNAIHQPGQWRSHHTGLCRRHCYQRRQTLPGHAGTGSTGNTSASPWLEGSPGGYRLRPHRLDAHGLDLDLRELHFLGGTRCGGGRARRW